MVPSFRERFYGALTKRADALFELTDAILVANRIHSPVHLCLEAMHRRWWGSLYAALSKGRINDRVLHDLLVSCVPGTNSTPVYAVDISPWLALPAGALARNPP
jgi:hypothetical protein